MRSSTASNTAVRKRLGKVRRRLAILGVALLVGAGLAGASATPAFADDLGGVDMDHACQYQYGLNYHAYLYFTGFFDSWRNTVMSWGCGPSHDDMSRGINVDEECKVMHGMDAHAAFGDYLNPFSWYCTSN
jgi:hypothetical protein